MVKKMYLGEDCDVTFQRPIADNKGQLLNVFGNQAMGNGPAQHLPE